MDFVKIFIKKGVTDLNGKKVRRKFYSAWEPRPTLTKNLLWRVTRARPKTLQGCPIHPKQDGLRKQPPDG